MDDLLKGCTGITADSRQVKPGFIYVAIKGNKLNGNTFIPEAVAKGAKIIITNDKVDIGNYNGVKVINVTDTYEKLAHLANEFYQPQPAHIVAVTGTSGKTSVVNFYQQISEFLGKKSASIGSLGVISSATSINLEDPFATPDAVTLNQVLMQLASNGVTHVAMEASSHGIKQKRLKFVKLEAAAFTNFSQDHLDYHGTMNDYFESKLKLFTSMLNGADAILNADISEFNEIASRISTESSSKIITYGKHANDIKLVNVHDKTIELKIFDKEYKTQFNVNGSFQVYNLMAAIGLAISTNLNIDQIIKVVPYLKAAIGRLEMVAIVNNAKIFVDYAHKPDALKNVLQTLKNECSSKLYVIFGCGGDRDKTKRPLMGSIATEFADEIIITDDNPRTENASEIRKQILAGCNNRALQYDDRAVAIYETIRKLQANDVLIVAGKGHENYQIIGDKKSYFSDKDEILKVIKDLG